MNRLLAIARRETTSFFHSAMSPVVVAGFLILVGFFFTLFIFGYSEASLASMRSGRPDPSLNLAQGVLQPLVADIAVMLLFLLPAVTMRLFSGEYRSGRYDLLMSYPVSDWTWVGGKFLSVMLVSTVLLATTLFYFGTTIFLGHPDFGPMASSVVGLTLLAGVLAAWGLFFSSLVSYQVVSYFLTFGFLLILYAVGALEVYVPAGLGHFLRGMAVWDHFQRFSRGVIDTRDIVYYLSMTVLGLYAATASLGGRRLPPGYRLMRGAPVVVLALLLVAVNILAERHPVTWDWTRNQRYNLAPQTVRILRDLDRDIRITCFNQRLDPYRRNLETFLNACRDQSSRVRVEMADLERDLALVESFGIDRTRTVIVEDDSQRMRLNAPQETAIINAIFRLQTGSRPVVYTLLGHGERRIDNVDRGGYSTAAQVLSEEGYLVKELFLGEGRDLPGDADVILLASPKLDIGDDELEALSGFLSGGGAVLALLDPQTPSSVAEWTRRYNVRLGEDFVASMGDGRSDSGFGPRTVLVQDGYSDHKICEGLEGIYTLFPLVQSLRPDQRMIPGIDGKILLRSSRRTWAEKDPMVMASGRPAYNEGVDRPGPVTIGVTVEVAGEVVPEQMARGPERVVEQESVDPVLDRLNEMHAGTDLAGPKTVFSKEETGHLVIIGDSDFASNANIQLHGNLNLFLNIFGWLEKEENLVGRRGRRAMGDPVVLSEGGKQLVGWICVLGWPILLGAGCTFIVLRRRFSGKFRGGASSAGAR